MNTHSQKNQKIFIVHGFNSSPNSSWIPWLMAELKQKGIYAVSLFMPHPEKPLVHEWVNEIKRVLSYNKKDELFLVGHSLGCAAILNFLQNNNDYTISGVLLVSGRSKKTDNVLTQNFYEFFDFQKIKHASPYFKIIHGENDPMVSVENAYFLGEQLEVVPTIIKNGGHLITSEGVTKLPEALEALLEMMK